MSAAEWSGKGEAPLTMAWLPLADFRRVGDVPDESIDRFRDEVPEEIVELWSLGTGLLGDGFLRVVDPGPLVDVLRRGLVLGERAVPVFATAFGDILYWQDSLMSAVIFRHGVIEGVAKNLQLLPRKLADPTFYEGRLAIELWPSARDELGVPDMDECFGFVPLLVLGGPECVENLKRAQLREHLDLLVQATGSIA